MVLLRSLSLDEKGGEPLVPLDEVCEGSNSPDQEEVVSAGDLAGPVALAEPDVQTEDYGGAYLPDECVKLIQTHLITNEAAGATLLHLLSMTAVCKQWRALASELPTGFNTIAFDCFDQLFPSQPSVQRFRKLASTQKEQVFTGAAKLVTGYTDVTLCGEGVSDRVVQEMALKSGSQLKRCKVQGCSGVTDTSLSTLVSQARGLTSLELEDLAKPNPGRFLTLLFDGCESLTSLQLANMPGLNWTACKAAAATWAEKNLTRLSVRGVNLDADFGTAILPRMPKLRELELDGPARNVRAAAQCCLGLVRVSYTVASRASLDEALGALMALRELRQLELVVRNFTLCADQLRVIGMLPLTELRLDSFIYRQQPTLSRSSYSHVDNEGVKALVDAICNRWAAAGSTAGEMRPLKLSLCGASALTHDAVSALLRLPILTELDIGGCARIIAMDKMRLVAKVRAGRELLDCGRRAPPAQRSSRFPGLMM